MAYSAIAKVKKNSPYALITSPGISDSATSIPVDHLEHFSDIDGVLIVDGISIWDPTDSDPTHREEITITARSGTSGAGNLTGATRGVKADGTNGAARAFSAGARIAVNFTTGKMGQIADNFAAHQTALSGKAIGPGSSTAGHVATFVGTDGLTLADGGGSPAIDSTVFHKTTTGEIAALTEKTTPVSADLLVIEDSAASNAKKKIQIGNLPSSGGGASLWTALGTPTYASSSAFTLAGDQTALLYAGRALKYTISGVVYPGRVVSATYSSPNTTVTVRGWPLTNNLTAVSYGDDSRTGTVSFVIPNYYEPSATAATMLNDRVRLASGYTWSKPPSYIIGLDLQHIANDGSTAPNVNGVINGNLLSTANTNAGPAMSSTSLISTGIDLNTTLANILISTGQKLECKVTVNSGAAYQNATDLSITYIWVDIS